VNHDAFALTLPSRGEYLGTARSFAAAVARHFAITGEEVEDLKVAISEACVDALESGSAVALHAEDEGRVISFVVDAPERDETIVTEGGDELGAAVRMELIRTLFPDAEVVVVDDRRAIRFSLPVG
jgi:anti-sigma regulatory factor (Ser/Thr protein kinase)